MSALNNNVEVDEDVCCTKGSWGVCVCGVKFKRGMSGGCVRCEVLNW